MSSEGGANRRAGDRGSAAVPPHRVRVPVNIHHWDEISFLHWRVEAADIARLLPDGLEVVIYDGSAWVGITPFFIRVRPPALQVPPGWAFPETNLRTYVRGRDGRVGVWFLHMEVTARWFVATMRALGLPYVRREMSVEADDGRITYTSRAVEPASVGGHRIVVRPGAQLDPPEGGPLACFLTAWWGAYHRPGPLLYTPVEHPAWRLQAADVDTWEVAGLFGAAGLPAPASQPVGHFSHGVTVKLGAPQPVC